MNRENVISVAKEKLGSIAPVSENVFCGDIQIKDLIAGKYYLDFNDKITLDDFSAYQEHLLANDYYSFQGTLPWNIYLFLIRDYIDPTFKSEVEKDEKYARKFVFNDTEFTHFFSKRSSSEHTSENLVSLLIDKLDKAGLHDVYGKETYVGTIENFKRKTPKKSSISFSTPAMADPKQIKSITSLKLNSDYRTCPKEPRQFKFGEVNLFYGKNGVGKTSLLEAIELIICGRGLRNMTIAEKANCIEAYFNGSNIGSRYNPNDTKLYQARDTLWYSSTYNRLNYMPNSFNRYNFFNSDAAFTFSNSSEEIKVRESLNDLIFGAEYNYIKDRINRLIPDFRRELNRLKKDFNDADARINNSIETIERQEKKNSDTFYETAIDNNVKEIGVLSAFEIRTDYSQLEDQNNRIQTILELIQELYPNQKLSYNETNQRLKVAEQKRAYLEELVKGIKEIDTKIAETASKANSASNLLDLLNQLSIFLKNEMLFQLEGLSKREAEIESILNKGTFLTQFQIPLEDPVFKSKNTLSNEIAQTKEKLETTTNKINEVNKQIKSISESLNSTSRLIAEIKSLGKRYLEVTEDKTHCPLCTSVFDEHELKERITKLPDIETNTDELILLNSIIAAASEELRDLQLTIETLDKLQLVYSTIFSIPRPVDVAISEVLKSLEEYNSLINVSIEEKNSLEALKTLAQSFGVDELLLNTLKIKINEKLPEVPFSISSKESFENKRIELEGDVAQYKQQGEQLNGKREEILQKAVAIQTDESAKSLDDIISAVVGEVHKLQKANEYFLRLFELIQTNESRNVEDFLYYSRTLAKNMSSYKEHLQNQLLVKEALLNKSSAEKFKKDNMDLLSRLENADAELSRLNDQNDLQEFFEKNMAEVVDIFKSIHSPKEFTTIQFNQGKLYLKTEGGELRSVTQISTGQRSALALALFLNLNRKLKNGPDIIMFDDPVSFVDDLNILSFLDYLRFFTLREGKQVFLATANSKLASLIEKKFTFLGDERFKKWNLERTSA